MKITGNRFRKRVSKSGRTGMESKTSPYGGKGDRVFPQLELLTVSFLPRPSKIFWSRLVQASEPIVTNGGIFQGPRLNGNVLRAVVTGHYNVLDHTIEVVAQLDMVTNDGALIKKADRGTWRGTAGTIERLINGEHVAASEYYFIGILKYSCLEASYQWLEKGDYLSHGAIEGDQLKISQFRVMDPVRFTK
jgi:Protein of unknown function (DUF3237)